MTESYTAYEPEMTDEEYAALRTFERLFPGDWKLKGEALDRGIDDAMCLKFQAQGWLEEKRESTGVGDENIFYRLTEAGHAALGRMRCNIAGRAVIVRHGSDLRVVQVKHMIAADKLVQFAYTLDGVTYIEHTDNIITSPPNDDIGAYMAKVAETIEADHITTQRKEAREKLLQHQRELQDHGKRIATVLSWCGFYIDADLRDYYPLPYQGREYRLAVSAVKSGMADATISFGEECETLTLHKDHTKWLNIRAIAGVLVLLHATIEAEEPAPEPPQATEPEPDGLTITGNIAMVSHNSPEVITRHTNDLVQQGYEIIGYSSYQYGPSNMTRILLQRDDDPGDDVDAVAAQPDIHAQADSIVEAVMSYIPGTPGYVDPF